MNLMKVITLPETNSLLVSFGDGIFQGLCEF